MDLSTVFQSTSLITPEIALLLAGMAILILSPVLKDSENSNYFLYLGVAGIILSFVLNLGRFDSEAAAFSGSLRIDSFSAYFNCLFLLASLITVLVARDYLKRNTPYINEFYTLILFCTSGMMILASSVEFMTLFVGFEIMSIAVYILSGFDNKSTSSTESGIKYLVLGGFSSGILLYGIALLYGASGTLHFTEIISAYDGSPMYITGVSLVLAGFVFKIGAVPLHQWVPDIYQGAPLPVTGYMSVAVKSAAFAVLLRIVIDLAILPTGYLLTAVQIVAVLTMIIGNVAAIYQSSVKRMLAYSSIAHAGYVLVGVAALIADRSVGGQGIIFYLFAYTFMNLGAFAILSYLSRENRDCDTFDHIAGIWKRKPLTAIALGIFMFSLAGIPPTIGFFSKYRVFLSAVESGQSMLAVIGIIASVVSAYYYLKVLVYAFMKQDEYGFGSYKPVSSIAITILAIGTVFFGIIPVFSWQFAVEASRNLLTFIY